MHRREFIRKGAILGSAFSFPGAFTAGADLLFTGPSTGWFNRSMRWAQLAFVDTDPRDCDPDAWLAYFKKIHADGALLSAGGVTAFYPTDIPLHHRSEFLAGKDLLGYLLQGCRKMGMTVCLRTDPHAARQDVFDAHPDWIAVTADGKKRRHWANPDLWVTCALGPYNFEFMTAVHKEIMNKYAPEGIFSNRWSGQGICYCEHCRENFREFSNGLEIPGKNFGEKDSAGQRAALAEVQSRVRYDEWNLQRLKELWFLWDAVIREATPSARFIPNGFPDKKLTAELADIFFVDRQARSGLVPPWHNGRGAKELRAAGMGVKPLINIFSVGTEEVPRWKDSVNPAAEIRVWAASGIANGMLPCFVKFGAALIDKRWMPVVEQIYDGCFRSERYLRNIASMARVAIVITGQPAGDAYGKAPWQKDPGFHLNGMYHALVEARIPFEMLNANALDNKSLEPFKLLVLANTAAISDEGCQRLRAFVHAGGCLAATFESTLYNEDGKRREDFALADLFGVRLSGEVEGPMQNSYLRLKKDPVSGQFHPVLAGLEDAVRIINGTYRLPVQPLSTKFPSPVTLVPSYPDLPMEDVYARVPETTTRELYLQERGESRVAYVPFDLDRAFWQFMSPDHGKLIGNIVRWALNEPPVVVVDGPGVVETTVWRQERSMTVHLVNLTNPMMMKGPFRELIPVDVIVRVPLPPNTRATGVKLLPGGQQLPLAPGTSKVEVSVEKLLDHQVVAIDLAKT